MGVIRAAGSGRRGATVLGAAAVAVVVAVGFVLTAGPAPYVAMGYPDPGAVTAVGTFVFRLVFDVAAGICVGALVFGAFFTAASPSGALGAEGWAAARLAGRAAWVWAGSAVLMVPFDAANSIGEPLTRVLTPQGLAGVFASLYPPLFWVASAGAAVVVAVGCQVVLRWRAAVALAVVAVLGLLPPVFVGHASAGAAHDYTMNAMVLHVVAGGAWLGVLVALAAALRRGTDDLVLAVRRYPAFATWCWVVLGASGVLAAVLLAPPAELLSSLYGVTVLVKVAALLLVGAAGLVGRRRVLRAPDGVVTRGRLAGLAALETALLLVTMGVTTGLTQPPPPVVFAGELTPVEIGVGYPLPVAPTPGVLLTSWRWDLLLGTAFLAAALLYLLAVRRLRARGQAWPVGRTWAWMGGCLLGVLGTSSGIAVYGPASISAHMATHMVLNMLAPLALVLGGPVSLALRALTPAAPGQTGPREWLQSLATSPLARLLAHPGLAAVLFTGSYYLLYFTGLFEALTSEHFSRMLLSIAIVVLGYPFWWVLIGVDPRPREFPHLGRLGLAFAVMPFHAVFAVILISSSDVIAQNYYRTLTLPWATDLLADQRLAGVVSLVLGELALLAAQAVLLVQWNRYDQMAGFRRDPDPAAGTDAAAYGEMLDALRRARTGPGR